MRYATTKVIDPILLLAVNGYDYVTDTTCKKSQCVPDYFYGMTACEWICLRLIYLLGCFYTPQWAGAEDGEGIRPAAGTGNE